MVTFSEKTYLLLDPQSLLVIVLVGLDVKVDIDDTFVNYSWYLYIQRRVFLFNINKSVLSTQKPY